MASLICYVIACVFFLFTALDNPITRHPLEFGLFFVALGLALSGFGWAWPTRR